MPFRTYMRFLFFIVALFLYGCNSGIGIGDSGTPTETLSSRITETQPAQEQPTAVVTPTKASDATAQNTPSDSSNQKPVETINLTGEITLWHSFSKDNDQQGHFSDLILEMERTHPELKINSIQLAESELSRDYLIDSLNQAGPDLVIARSDHLDLWVENGIVLDVSNSNPEILAGFHENSLDALSVEGVLFGYPLNVETSLYFYDKQKVSSPPETSTELDQMVSSGVSLSNIVSSYHIYTWSGNFSGQLFDENYRCIADQNGWVDAVNYLTSLKNAGMPYYQDDSVADRNFMERSTDSIINGSWSIPVYQAEFANQLGMAKIPEGPSGKANPLASFTGVFVNPNSQYQETAIQLARYLTGAASVSDLSSIPGFIPVRNDLQTIDPTLLGLIQAGADSQPVFRNPEFDNYWEPFQSMYEKVIFEGMDSQQALREACGEMNSRNQK